MSNVGVDFVGKDDVTAVVNRVMASMNRLESAGGRSANAMGSSFGQASGAADKFGSTIGDVAGKAGGPLGELASGIGGISTASLGLLGIAGGVAMVISKIASAAWEAAKSIVEFGVNAAISFGKAVLEGTRWAHEQEAVFARFAGGSELGRAMLERLIKTAMKIGVPIEAFTDSVKSLMNLGFGEKMASDLSLLKSDLEAVGVSSRGVMTTMKLLSKIEVTKFAKAADLEAFTRAGVSSAMIYAELAKATGKSVEQLQLLAKAGKLSSDEVIPAIEAAFKRKLGIKEFGDAAKDAADPFFKLQNMVDGTFKLIGSKLVPLLANKLNPITEKFAKFLDSKAGGKFLDQVADSVASLVGLLPDVVPYIEKIVKWLGGPGPKQLFDDIISMARTLINLLRQVIGLMNMMSNVGNKGAFGSGMRKGSIADPMFGKGLAGGMTASMGTGLGPAGAAAGGPGFDVGQSTAMGMAAGMMAGIPQVAAAGAALAAAAKSSMTSSLDIHSPSGVFREYGMQSAEGYGIGVMDYGVPNELAAAFDPRGLAKAASGGSSKSFSASSNATISISGAADPQATAAAVREVLIGELAGAFEQLHLEVSGG